MAQSERWQKIGREILFSARTELYMSLPFLDTALAALTVSALQCAPVTVEFTVTKKECAVWN